MKRIFMVLAMMFSVAYTSSFAQTQEEFEESLERIEKLSKLTDKAAKSTGNEVVDGYVAQLYATTLRAVEISTQLNQSVASYRNFETKDILDGDLADSATTLEELSDNIMKQAEAMATLSKTAGLVISTAKDERNPLKMMKYTKVVSFSKSAVPLVIKESKYQVATIKSLLQKK